MRFLILAVFILSNLHADPILDQAKLSLLPQKKVLSLLKELETHHVVEGASFDQILMVQVAIENAMAKLQEEEKIQEFLGIIYREEPALSFCRKPNESNQIGGDISHPLFSQETIHRKYLEQDGKLIVVYPQRGLEKRSDGEQEIYQQALKEFSLNLVDCPLNTNTVDSDLVGITYLFLDQEYELYGLSFGESSIWFGPITNPEIQSRFNKIFAYFAAVGGPKI